MCVVWGRAILVDFLLLVDAELARAHVHQEEETAAVGWGLGRDFCRRVLGGKWTYTMERIWKKSYLAKSIE